MRVTLAVLDRLGIARCVLGGNSLGGAVSWRTALAHPARVEKLILVDAGGYPQHATSVPIGMRLLRVPGLPWLMQHTLPRSPGRAGHAQCVRGSEPGDAGDGRALDRAHAARRQSPRFARSRPSALGPTPRSSAFRELKLPTLIVWGGRDRLIPPDDAERFHRDIAGSVLVDLRRSRPRARGGGPRPHRRRRQALPADRVSLPRCASARRGAALRTGSPPRIQRRASTARPRPALFECRLSGGSRRQEGRQNRSPHRDTRLAPTSCDFRPIARRRHRSSRRGGR